MRAKPQEGIHAWQTVLSTSQRYMVNIEMHGCPTPWEKVIIKCSFLDRTLQLPPKPGGCLKRIVERLCRLLSSWCVTHSATMISCKLRLPGVDLYKNAPANNNLRLRRSSCCDTCPLAFKTSFWKILWGEKRKFSLTHQLMSPPGSKVLLQTHACVDGKTQQVTKQN